MPVKIMVVDDEMDMKDLILQQFREESKQEEYKFDFAANGKEALEKLKRSDSFDLILLDINMQVMDGLTFLNEMKKLDNPLLKAIVVTAFGDMPNIRCAMNRGAYDFITKPIDFKDLKATMKKYLKEREILDRRDKLIVLKNELKFASIIQQKIFPNNFHFKEGFTLHARIIPAEIVCGDLYNFFYIDANRVGIVLGDVKGKGIKAAIAMAASQIIFKNIALRDIPADTCIENVNKEFREYFEDETYITVFYGILDIRDGHFEYCCAGHRAPFLISESGKVIQLDQIGGFCIGHFPDSKYEAGRVKLESGDTIFVYTDGITDANKDGEEEEHFGMDRLKETIHNIADLTVDKMNNRIIEEVLTFSNGKQFDDITCLALRYMGKSNK